MMRNVEKNYPDEKSDSLSILKKQIQVFKDLEYNILDYLVIFLHYSQDYFAHEDVKQAIRQIERKKNTQNSA